MLLAVILVLSFPLSVYVGDRLARQGITADNALQHYQQQVYAIGLGLLGLGTLFGVVLKAGRHSPWVPSWLLLYTGAYFWHGVVLGCGMAAGLLLGLEWPGRREPKRLQQLGLFLLMSLGAIAFLFHQGQPITNLITESRMVEGVVLQTTPFSCSAAAIATLHRQVNPQANTTELEVAQLAGTSRQGTNTLGQIRAMEQLGLEPEYRRNVAIADLVNRNQLAILHVIERVEGPRIQHAIALLDVDAVAETLTVANPLYGIQVKSFADMDDYWLREAVFVNVD